MRKLTLEDIPFLVALVCFVAALLIAEQWVVNGGNFSAWLAGGLIALTVALARVVGTTTT